MANNAKKKARPSTSLKGKKPANTSGVAKKRTDVKNPSKIRNKLKRSEMYGKYLADKRQKKRELRLQRAKEAEELGEDAHAAKQTPRTLDNTREQEPTTVRQDDDEVAVDEAEDEFAEYFADTVRPKILLTTRPRPSRELFHFIADLQRFLPKLYFYPRKSYSIKDICTYGTNREFTHLIVLSEKSKVCNGMIVSHLRPSVAANHGLDSSMEEAEKEEADEAEDKDGSNDEKNLLRRGGPTAFFKVSNVILSADVPDHGSASSHVPELVLNGFSTRLGHRAGRFLGSLFPHNAQFRGRQVATFHNQRDYIFVRHHRYIFEESNKPLVTNAGGEGDGDGKDSKKKKTKTRLQELGPRFTLKLRWIQEGTFDTQFGEYEWIHKRK
eukprot:CAMPEP_0181031724 /NCGR_PEP_ID=MMETSP1070-20121207/6380_1 /TAXON_ID=265543 /ORGANISM="Minutocellus polymorphus, Strain NH13" /LENGTH=382 /DNA_ID=CAMNT_0023109111 /DNA_START=103 /DNA_END=1248 /DNA_ORIENTATION=+